MLFQLFLFLRRPVLRRLACNIALLCLALLAFPGNHHGSLCLTCPFLKNMRQHHYGSALDSPTPSVFMDDFLAQVSRLIFSRRDGTAFMGSSGG